MNTTKEIQELIEVLKEKEIQELIKSTHNDIWNSNRPSTRGTIKHIKKYRISTVQRLAINIIHESTLKTKELANNIYYRKYTKVTQESFAVLSICFNDVILSFNNNINDSNKPRGVVCTGRDVFLYNFDTDSLGTPEELLFEIQLMQNFNSSISPEDILVLLEIYTEVQNIINPKE